MSKTAYLKRIREADDATLCVIFWGVSALIEEIDNDAGTDLPVDFYALERAVRREAHDRLAAGKSLSLHNFDTVYAEGDVPVLVEALRNG